MKSKRPSAAAVAILGFVVLSSGPSMYYPWAGQFPWDRPGTVNPDVISGALMATSTHWPSLSDYGSYRATFGQDSMYQCDRRQCRGWWHW